MRVIAGSLGGRIFQSPKGHHTHPMSEKARGAIFNALGDVNGLNFLDAYAGSGALSIEAISRGAEKGVAIDSDLTAWKATVANLEQLGIGRAVQAVRMGVTSWLNGHPDEEYDLVFADPPYDDIKLHALSHLTERVKSGGVFVLSWPGGKAVPTFRSLREVSQKSLGDIRLVFYRH